MSKSCRNRFHENCVPSARTLELSKPPMIIEKRLTIYAKYLSGENFSCTPFRKEIVRNQFLSTRKKPPKRKNKSANVVAYKFDYVTRLEVPRSFQSTELTR